jgi:adenylate cyclase
MEELTVPGFHGAPAVAVLPFDNLSGDSEQEYFADGIAEDLITRLSAFREFPVIARNSSFTYKGKSVDVKQMSRELGARYVVEGSVRRAGDRVRISAQLIDATTGAHVWAERYDRELKDVFAVQDEITEAIVASMYPDLLQSELARAARKETGSLDAWESVQRGSWHFIQNVKSDNTKARAFFERASELDPQFARAFFGLALTHYADLVSEWTPSRDRSIQELNQAARRGVALDNKDPFGQLVLGRTYWVTGDIKKAVACAEVAVQLDPSFAHAYLSLGLFLAHAGRPEEAIENIERGMRLSPRDLMMHLASSYLAQAHFGAGRYEEAVDWAQRSVQQRPDYDHSYRTLAASYAHLGQLDEARAALREAVRMVPEFSLGGLKLLWSGSDPAFLEPYLDGLRKAGLKE